ncbi:MAG: DUF697 domain-containing protein [Okeania sp. SIO3I5]|uniref:YcjF family protein n=1 Tax=Okeania sp. SIO3I5 TaxID=2607805 RepID=UPI0013B994BD|nr:GTP-binding protein [Okeania sp. SIO3I5]NEQ37924.1 DUF697 domain-containing protein [Okeania sp. SIO3I5]
MSTSRLLILIFGSSFILLLIIWLISSLSWLYSQILWSAPPVVANLLLLLLIVLMGIVLFTLVYYLRLYTIPKSKRQRKSKITKPVVKSEAVSESLKAVRQQIISIQDEVARQALLNRSQKIENSIAQGDIKVVVFGTGSAGKTSVVNILMGRMVGRVEAPMGSTKVGETYRLKLSALEREILITDTPGILEAGIAGTERSQIAKVLATEANLLLFVVDNDLQQSEYLALKSLAEIGKRSLLVFNKTDLYTEEDKEAIVVRLRERLLGVVSKMDIVAIAAHPNSVRLETGEIYQPEANIVGLIERLAAVLRLEGEDLIADNILLQSQILGEEARGLIDAQRRKRGEKVVEKFQWIGGGVIAATPIPVVDVLATAAVNAQMVIEIGKVYGCELNLERGQELAISLAKTFASLGIVEGVIKLISTALQLNVATFIIGKAIQGVSAAYLTRIAGKSFIEYFSQNQDWGDGGITEVVQKQFELTKKDEFVRLFIQDAIAKVVEPLTNIYSDDEEVETESEFDEEEVEINYQSQPSKKVGDSDDWETKSRAKREDW